MTPYSYVWEFEVRPGCEAEFERHYGPDGSWVELFRAAHAVEFTALDARCEALTVSERELGRFEVV